MEPIRTHRTRARATSMALLAAAAVLVVPQHPAHAHDLTQDPPRGWFVDGPCREFIASPDVPLEEARNLIPERYRSQFEAERDAFGTADDPAADTAKLYVSGKWCEELTFREDGVVRETARDVIETYIAVRLVRPGSPTAPPGGPAAAPHPALVEDYVVEWATNSAQRATWLKGQTGLGSEVKVIENLAFTHRQPGPPGLLNQSLRVEVPRPADSPFTMTEASSSSSPTPATFSRGQWTSCHRTPSSPCSPDSLTH